MKKVYRVFAFLWLAAYCSHGLNAQWRKSPGPFVGPIGILKVDASGTAFATSANQGLFVSTTNGSPEWTFKSYASISGIGSDGRGRVVMACANGSVVFSTDGGQTFGGRVYSYEYTDFVFPRDGSILSIDYDGLYKLDTNSGYWHFFGAGITGNIDVITMHPNGHLFIGTADNGILRSTDNGATWDTAGLQQSWVETMAIDSSGAIFASTEDGRFVRSSDEGKTWTSVKNGFSTPYYIKNPCTGRNGLAFADQYDHPGGTTVFVTTNGGIAWTKVAGRFPDDTDVISMALAPDGSLLAATNYAGIFRTTDNGGTWGTANDGLTDTYITCFGFDVYGGVIAGTSQGVFRTTDQGDSWNLCSKYNQDIIYNLYVSPTDSMVAAVGYNGIYYSTDLGKTWFLSSTNKDPTAQGIWRGVDLTPKGTLLCGSDSIYRSTNGGNSWKGTYSEQQFDPQLFATARDGTIYCVTHASVFHSTDDGLSWEPDTLLRYQTFSSVVCDRSGDILLGETGTESSTIYRSTNGGMSWVQYANNEHGLYDIHEDSSGILYAGSDTGAFRSTDNGETWKNFSDGLGLGGSSIAINTIGAGTLGTIFASGGPLRGVIYADDVAVYRRSGTSSTVSKTPSSELTFSVWPNPSHTAASLKFFLPESCNVNVALYDLLGTERFEIANGNLSQGEHTFSFNCKALPAGAYMVCIRTSATMISQPFQIQ